MKERTINLGLSISLLILTAAVFFTLGVHFDILRGEREYNTLVVYTDYSKSSEPGESSDNAPQPEAAPGTIPLNSATVEQLMTVPGIGETFARRIIAYRDRVGGFASVEQLMEIEGIGEGRYATWSVYFTLGEFSD